jgi:hypothetical protein
VVLDILINSAREYVTASEMHVETRPHASSKKGTVGLAAGDRAGRYSSADGGCQRLRKCEASFCHNKRGESESQYSKQDARRIFLPISGAVRPLIILAGVTGIHFLDKVFSEQKSQFKEYDASHA